MEKDRQDRVPAREKADVAVNKARGKDKAAAATKGKGAVAGPAVVRARAAVKAPVSSIVGTLAI